MHARRLSRLMRYHPRQWIQQRPIVGWLLLALVLLAVLPLLRVVSTPPPSAPARGVGRTPQPGAILRTPTPQSARVPGLSPSPSAGLTASLDLRALGLPLMRPRHIGLQVGHWRWYEAPLPLQQPGVSFEGITEAEVNLRIAQLAADLLTQLGHQVDLLPAWFAEGYQADVVVAVHVDGPAPPEIRGFFADRPASSVVADREAQLVELLNAAYGEATGIPHVYRGSDDSRHYYGFRLVTPQTPMALLECGMLTNVDDRAVLLDHPELAAKGLATAIVRFLAST